MRREIQAPLRCTPAARRTQAPRRARALTAWLPALVLVVPALAAPAAAQDAMTPLEAVTYRQAGSPAISPDGSHIAYRLSVPRQSFAGEDGPAWTELHVVDGEGHDRAFVHGEVNVGALAWVPGGGEISYLAKREGDEHKALYAIPVAGGESRRVLAHGAGIEEYAWSPDGGRLAFLAEEPETAEEKELAEKGFDQDVFEEQLKPVKLWLATPGEEGAEPVAIELPGSASELAWSPAGDRLSVALAPTPLVDDEYVKRRFHILDATTGAITGVVEHAAKLGTAVWSPDGEHLAFIAGEDINDPQEGRLYVVPAAGGKPRDLLPGYLGHVADLAWLDSDTLIYIGEEGVEAKVGGVDLAGPAGVLVPPGEAVWSSLSLAADGTAAALVGDTPRHPDEIFHLAVEAGEVRRLTDSNPWLAGKRLAPQEVVDFQARDGIGLQGILIRPLDAETGKPNPLVLVVHGGPEAHYSNGWLTTYSRPAQVLAARGFAVFHPNYRGSTGRGVEFSKTSQGDPAGKEFDDLVDAVDYLVAVGVVDREKVGITGGSYGGYATAWAATALSDRFAAGVMVAGISDKISKWGTSDIPNEVYYVHDRLWPWADWKLLLERSPIYYAAKGRTPLLILHGEADARVHPGQAMELYRHLKTLGKTPVRLVLYPGEGHGNRRAASRLDACLRVLRWMEHYLQGPGGAAPPPQVDYPRPEGATP